MSDPARYQAGPQPADISGDGQNDCNLLYLTNKHVFNIFAGDNCPVGPSWLRAWCRESSTYFELR